jgi:decaprenylphospho-beta-D-erythro-pentofuranosid-2-ulose 2-reductase
MAAAVPRPIRSAFVLGSTSVVAQAICRELAQRGCERFHLLARNSEANRDSWRLSCSSATGRR